MPYPILRTKRGPSAYRYPDAEGAPDRDGRRYHGALDWFAPGGSPVFSPVTGVVVEARRTTDVSGQVFGGTVKVRDRSGRVFVLRHSNPLPSVGVGDHVAAGQHIADVTAWRDGPPHIHLEVWRTLAGGYRLPNMVDPGDLDWTLDDKDETPDDPLSGAYLRVVLDDGRLDVVGRKARGAVVWIAEHGLETDRCAVAWRGPGRRNVGVWRGRRDVVAVCRAITAKYI